MLASLSAAESAPAAALEDALELDEPELDVLDVLEEPELPLEEEPEADAVDEDDDAVESPALSVFICDAVSQAATKKACEQIPLVAIRDGMVVLILRASAVPTLLQ